MFPLKLELKSEKVALNSVAKHMNWIRVIYFTLSIMFTGYAIVLILILPGHIKLDSIVRLLLESYTIFYIFINSLFSIFILIITFLNKSRLLWNILFISICTLLITDLASIIFFIADFIKANESLYYPLSIIIFFHGITFFLIYKYRYFYRIA